MQGTVFNPNEDMLVFGVRRGNNGGRSFKQVLSEDTEFSELIWQPEDQTDNDPGVGGVWANEYYVGKVRVIVVVFIL